MDDRLELIGFVLQMSKLSEETDIVEFHVQFKNMT